MTMMSVSSKWQVKPSAKMITKKERMRERIISSKIGNLPKKKFMGNWFCLLEGPYVSGPLNCLGNNNLLF